MDAEWFTPDRETGQRHKRSHAEMSQAITLSPSPISFRGQPSAFSRYNSATPSSNDIFYERRRTPHPHNPPMQSFHAAAEDMSGHSQTRPRLEHRASQTLIDLTNEADDFPVLGRRPPQLGRSDSQRMAFQVIDLTEDDVDVQITGARNRELPPPPRPNLGRVTPPPPLPRPVVPRPRPNAQGLFVPLDHPPPGRPIHRAFAGEYAVMMEAGINILEGRELLLEVQNARAHLPRLDYRYPAFAEQKPDHVPPEPAKPGFTRSPMENDTIICPSCEEELVHEKGNDEPLSKKNGKAPTRKEREEHPFWVVKDCGHVYCNHCFQNRRPVKNQPANVSFPGGASAKKVTCAVEDCNSDVGDKAKWIGVFL